MPTVTVWHTERPGDAETKSEFSGSDIAVEYGKDGTMVVRNAVKTYHIYSETDDCAPSIRRNITTEGWAMFAVGNWHSIEFESDRQTNPEQATGLPDQAAGS